jgi:phosphatidylglycerol lysyltransferase
MNKGIWRYLGSVVSGALFVLALLVIHHKLRQYHYRDIVNDLTQVSVGALLAAVILTILDYWTLTAYDALALSYIRHPLKYSRVVLASFIGYVFSINLTVLGGSAARYRIYSALGISASEVAKLIVFCGVTFWLGFFALGGVVFVLQPQVLPEVPYLPFSTVRPIGFVFLALVCAYLVYTVIRKNPVRLRGWQWPVPRWEVSLGQILISAVDWLLAGGVLYCLLPGQMGLPYRQFLGMFLLAQAAGLLSYIPGGLGVFDTGIVLLLSPYGSSSGIVASLLLYRMIYYFLPLAIATVLLATHEVLANRRELRRFELMFGRWGSAVIPEIFAVTSFIAGAILLFGGALPVSTGRMAWLKDFLPLPAIEVSHFLGSLTGAGLIILSRGLRRRLDTAYHVAVALLAGGVVFSLMKGLDYEEALVLATMFIALLPCRKEFYRKAFLVTRRFTAGWFVLTVVVVLCSVWLGFFLHRHTPYSNQLWWQFAFYADAPRFLRATTGAAIVLGFYAVMGLLRPHHPKPPAPPSQGEFETVAKIVTNSRRTYSWLALLGDKQFIISARQDAFIMYAVEGRSWVAMGDPVGSKDQYEDLVWRFRELSDRYGGWPVFYQVDSDHLDLYLELGLKFLKLGEEARVELSDFSLEGNSRRGLRHAHNRILKQGFSFQVVTPAGVSQITEELRRISDAWLTEKHTREKGFSLGFFNPEYLKRLPAGIVSRNDKIVAFANIWASAEKDELSVDLMRYVPDSPEGIMDYLFVEMMLWGRDQGYRSFNFGMAPLSGFQERALAPFWSKVGAFVFRHGEHFYNFQGLRQYKEKFDPVWQPKYVACQTGLVLPRILTNLESLISGGLTGVVTK